MKAYAEVQISRTLHVQHDDTQTFVLRSLIRNGPKEIMLSTPFNVYKYATQIRETKRILNRVKNHEIYSTLVISISSKRFGEGGLFYSLRLILHTYLCEDILNGHTELIKCVNSSVYFKIINPNIKQWPSAKFVKFQINL